MEENECYQLVLHCSIEAKNLGYKFSDELYQVYWNDIKNKWESKDNTCSGLSSVLLIGQRAPDFRLIRSDDLFIATLSLLFDRTANWVESFIYGYNNQNNSGTSINGHIAGSNIRKHINNFR